MPLWPCDYGHCLQPAVRIHGACILCDRHLCSEHLQEAFHKCPKWEDETLYDPAMRQAERVEMSRLFNNVNTVKLAEIASFLRNGIGSKIAPLHYDRATRSSVMGGMNYHIDIQFDDGVVWLARIRRFNATSPPLLLQDYIIESEVATLQFLDHTDVPVPKVYGFALATDATNEVGVGYILMEKLSGKAFDRSRSSDAQLRKVTEQLADIYLELRRYPFQSMGSLNQPGTDHIGPFASELLTDVEKSEISMGEPCSSAEEFHASSIRRVLALIIRKEMYVEQAVDAYLIHRFMLDLIPKICAKTSQVNEFFLKHPDDKGDQLLVDEDHNITGIIDWEWTYTAPVESAFNSPVLLLPVAKFYDGEQTVSDDESYLASCLEGRSHELANAVRAGRIQHYFTFCCGYDLSDWNGFLGLFRGLRDTAGMDDGITWDEWKTKALQRYDEDEALVTLLRATAVNDAASPRK